MSTAASPDDRRSVGGQRKVDLSADDQPVLPEQTRDDTDTGWGERPFTNDDRLRDERPPHWE